ncbi:MAG: putative porin [Candidatus Omnitrophica bacterium]|nr:putative porin [Candidatus Omnitrophota bacterium]
MKKFFLALFLGAIVFGACSSSSSAGEIDILVNKLVQKNILTPMEAEIILDETKQEVAKEIAEHKSYALPEWVQKMKLKGDLRVRYQYESKAADKGQAKYNRSRGRYRFRLGVTTDVADQVEVGFGLATGGADPRSTNQTMGQEFETPDIRLDYAYAKYSPLSSVDIYVGRFARKPVLWQTDDLLWDGDINPDGIAVSATHSVGMLDGFLNAGVFPMFEYNTSAVEKGSAADPAMYYAQVGVGSKVGEKISLKGAVAYYGFTGLEGKTFDNSAKTNTGNSTGLVYDYNTVNPTVELKISNPFEGIDLPIAIEAISFFGNYIYNPDPSDNNKGYLAGMKFGDKKIKNPGSWQIKYCYRHLETDAWLDIFPDSDAYGGETNVAGHEVAWSYAIKKNVILGLDYYNMHPINGSTSNTQHLIQADVLFKF